MVHWTKRIGLDSVSSISLGLLFILGRHGLNAISDLLPSLFPGKSQKPDTELILGPFHGRPACQSLALAPSRPGGSTGVCAKSFNAKATVIVRDVHSEPGTGHRSRVYATERLLG